MRLLPALLGSILGCSVLACAGPEAVAPTASTSPGDVDDPFETAYLRVGAVQVRQVDVPLGYSVSDMNLHGDLLFGDTWLPKGRKEPATLPFSGLSINNQRQILGPHGELFEKGAIVELGTPCEPSSYWVCGQPPQALALAENGDVVISYRRDAVGTPFDPDRFLAVWRARSGTWQQLGYLFGSGTSFVPTVISDAGWVATRMTASVPVQVIVRVTGPTTGYDLALVGACPAPRTTALDVQPRDINDHGAVVGSVLCDTGSGLEQHGAKWSVGGTPTPLDGVPATIDNAGNIAGVRDGRAVVWLANGALVDLSATVADVAPRKFLKDGKVFGSGAAAVVWRFGY